METTISTTTTHRIRELAAEIDQLGRTALEKVIEAGNLLRHCKSGIKHGEWLPWLERNFDFSDQTARNWMEISKADAEGKFKNLLNLSEAYNLVFANRRKVSHVSHNSGDNEWYTPENIIESARRVMGTIDLDPASCEAANSTVRAKRFYSKEDNGVNRPWSGNIWLNPPYSQPEVSQFAEKLAAEVDAGNISQALVLVNNATETSWFQTMNKRASAVCMIAGRVKFLDPDGRPGSPLQGQVVLYIGSDVSSFTTEFSKHGECLIKKPQPPPTIEVEVVEDDTCEEPELEFSQPAPSAPREKPPTDAYLQIMQLLPELTKEQYRQLVHAIQTRWIR